MPSIVCGYREVSTGPSTVLPGMATCSGPERVALTALVLLLLPLTAKEKNTTNAPTKGRVTMPTMVLVVNERFRRRGGGGGRRAELRAAPAGGRLGGPGGLGL